MAALSSGKYDGSVLFPDNIKSAKPKAGTPHALADPDEDIDYSQVDWETPAQDDWIITQKLLQEHQETKVKGNDLDAPDMPPVNFDDDIPPFPAGPTPVDADDLEWD